MIDEMLKVYVPTLTAPIRKTIVPGSAIVSRGTPDKDGYLLVYFEGNIYNSPAMRRFSQRVLHAAGRLVTRYPTIALANIKRDDMMPIGLYWTVPPRLKIEDYLTLEEWLMQGRCSCGRS